jgi:hypothetical protein
MYTRNSLLAFVLGSAIILAACAPAATPQGGLQYDPYGPNRNCGNFFNW